MLDSGTKILCRTSSQISQGEQRYIEREKLHSEEKECRGREPLGSSYFVSTVGLDDGEVRKSIRDQDAQDQRLEQLKRWSQDKSL